MLVQPTSHSRCGTKTETLDEIMDLTTFGSRSNVRQIGCYICPGCKDVKCVTNMLSYLSLINARQIMLNMKPYFIQGQILDKIDKCVQHHTNHISPHGDVFSLASPLV